MNYSHESFPGKPVQQADAREAAIAKGLRNFAKHFGFELKEPLHINGNGEYMLSVVNPESREYCGRFGDAVEFMNRHNPRTGIVPGARLIPENGWCYMNHFSVAKMLEEFEQTLVSVEQ